MAAAGAYGAGQGGAQTGQEVSFRCHGAMVWPRYVVSFFAPKLAIFVHRE